MDEAIAFIDTMGVLGTLNSVFIACDCRDPVLGRVSPTFPCGALAVCREL